jgi:hypothetical protein
MPAERNVPVPPDRAPGPCPACGSGDRLFTPNARRRPYDPASAYEPAWQCTRCGALEFIEDAVPPARSGLTRW